MLELPSGLVLWHSDVRQQLQELSYGHLCRIFVVFGLVELVHRGRESNDIDMPIRDKLLFSNETVHNRRGILLHTRFFGNQHVCFHSMLLSSHGGRSTGRNRCSSTVWQRLSTNANASGGIQTIEQLWEEYFSGPAQWWDNRVGKSNPKTPDFKHKVTRKALWVDGWSTPVWVKEMLKLVTEGSSHPNVGNNTRGSQDTARQSRVLKNNSRKGNSGPTSTRKLRQVDMPSTHRHTASTMSEATSILKHDRQKGITIDSYMYIEALQRCFKQKDLVSAKQVHDFIVKTGMEQHTYVANNLVRVYIRCGRLQDARQVFDRLVKKTIVSWNIMIGGYAEFHHGEDATEVFNRMCQEGVQPNEITYLNILKACTSPKGSKWGKEIHAHIRHGGFESDVRVGTALLKMYIKCGCLVDARCFFNRMVDHNIITWNVMIGGLAQHGLGHEAFSLFLQMQREGFKPDAFTYASILNPCASAGALEWVKEVHRQALKVGLESDVRVGSAFVHMYAKSGSIDDARLVFERILDRNVITWTMMIGGLAQQGLGHEAFSLFLQMQREGFKPDAFTYASILNPCASAGALEWVKEVHRQALKSGLESDLRVGNALIHMYAKSGSIDDARLVFDRMVNRDVITWNVMIGGLAQHGYGHEAFSLFLQMQRGGLVPDATTYVSILNPCASAGALEWVKEVHKEALKAGLETDVRVGSAFVHMYAKVGSIDDGRVVFERMADRDVITWNVMIGGLAQHGLGHEAFSLFLQMQREGFQPNASTYVSILNPCASAGALEWVKEVHRQALKVGLESDVRVGSAFVHMYAKVGSIDDGRVVFERMADRDVITWNVMIGGLAQHGLGHETLQVYEQMKAEDVKPNGFSFVGLLSACSHAGLVDEGRRLFLAMSEDYGIEPSVVHYSCMVDLLGRAGHLDEAKLFICNMPLEPDGVTWGALLGACRTYGNVELGELAFKELLKLEPEDASAYVLLSNIYAAAGKWDQVSFVRNMMLERGIHKEPGQSWIEVDNKIHHFVVGDTSHPEAKEIYAELNILAKMLKAEGYIPDTRLVLHNTNEEDKEIALCSHSEKLAIAYGLIRTPPGKPIYIHKNLRVCPDCHTATKFISKVTGREIVARDANRFHHFKDGVCSCGDYW